MSALVVNVTARVCAHNNFKRAHVHIVRVCGFAICVCLANGCACGFVQDDDINRVEMREKEKDGEKRPHTSM